MSDDNTQNSQVNFESLYLQAQQEIANLQHQIRLLALQINEMKSDKISNLKRIEQERRLSHLIKISENIDFLSLYNMRKTQ